MATASNSLADSATSLSDSAAAYPPDAARSAAINEQAPQDATEAPTASPDGLTAPVRPDFEQHEMVGAVFKWVGPISVCVALVLIIFLSQEAGSARAVTTVAFITGAAVGIERVIEGFWNALGSRVGVYWPMTSISRQVHELELELNDALTPFHGHLSQALTKAHLASDAAPAYLESAQKDLDTMQRRFDDIRAHGPSNLRMQLLAACAAQSVNFLVTKYQENLPQLRQGVALANTAIGGMQDFLATFKDNPGRRLLSLYLGALLGLALAAIFQLDVFAAINAASDEAASVGSLPATLGLRIAATGLLIGLGSNPTHEVIQVLQEYKKGKKGKNTAEPKLAISAPSASANS